MKLAHIEIRKLSVSPANMRAGKKPPDISDILPSIRARGILVPMLVRPNGSDESFEIVAGRRRFHAALAVANENGGGDPLPCAIMDEGDDAAAVEASLIENLARLDPDEVTQWVTFTRLVKEGRSVEDISATFGLPGLTVKRILALGNLLPRIRDLYRQEKIDVATVRHLTMASKSQQKSWLALLDDPEGYLPTGHQLKAWLFGGASISTKVALFDLASYGGKIVADLFDEEGYFADANDFWTAQNAAIEARRAAYLDAGWSDVTIVPSGDYFQSWEYEKMPKRKGGRVYIDVNGRGEVTFHEGYLTAKEARRVAKGEAIEISPKPSRPEVTSTMQTYIDLHRHAAVRAALTGHAHVALRLMVAHAIAGSRLWNVKPEPQTSCNEAVTESVETCAAEAAFDERRRAVLDLLGFPPDEPTVVEAIGDEYRLTSLFLRLLDLPDPALFDVIAIVMGETLASGGVAVEAVGSHIGVDMSKVWEADDAFFDLIRDKEVLTRIVAEVAGESIASANAGEKTKVLKAIVRDHLAGENGRPKVEKWVPRWMRFAPSAYTARGGVGAVQAHATVAELLAGASDGGPAPDAPIAGAMAAPEPDDAAEPQPLAA